MCTVLTQQAVYLLDHTGPRAWTQLLRVFHDLDPDSDPHSYLGVYSLSGQRLTDHRDFGSCLVALSEDEDVPAFTLGHLAPHVAEVSVYQQGQEVVFRGPTAAASDLWMGVPLPGPFATRLVFRDLRYTSQGALPRRVSTDTCHGSPDHASRPSSQPVPCLALRVAG